MSGPRNEFSRAIMKAVLRNFGVAGENRIEGAEGAQAMAEISGGLTKAASGVEKRLHSKAATNGLSEACDRGHWNEVGVWLERGAHPDGVEGWRVTPLEACARDGTWTAVKLLLDAGANVNKASDQDFTPLMAAVVGGSPKMVKRLLDAGADPMAVNDSGKTIWHMIGSSLNAKEHAMAGFLAHAGALGCLEARDSEEGLTPLMWWISRLGGGSVAALIALGARVDDMDREGLGAQAYIDAIHGAGSDEAREMKAALFGALAQREKKALEQEAVMAIKPGTNLASRGARL